MNYWDLKKDEQTRLDKAGVDYDLSACLEYNNQDFEITDIEKVLAVWEGENDGESWRWIIKVNKFSENYIYLVGWCDYTGWDCHSGASSYFFSDPVLACNQEKDENVKKDLINQVESLKNITWREKMDTELNTKDLPKITKNSYPIIENDEF